MERPFRKALKLATRFLEKKKLRYALIGGIATQVWGHARFTYDIYIKLRCENFATKLQKPADKSMIDYIDLKKNVLARRSEEDVL